MKLRIVLDIDNDAFSPPGPEIAGILCSLEECLLIHRGARGMLKDSNGNSVGTWEFTGRKSWR